MPALKSPSIKPTGYSLHRMKTPFVLKTSPAERSPWLLLAVAALFGCAAAVITARADETCSSPYLARIEGQEEFVYVWTLGVEGLGDGADKLVVVDVKPGSPGYGKVIHRYSVEGRHEAHHGGFTDDRRYLWLAGLESSRIFIFDVHSQPARPLFVKTIKNFGKVTGGSGWPARGVCAAGPRARAVPLERQGQGRPHCAR
jgi:selenium-binding protein 1